jgi:TRAP-type C4-dicarboxylate transport system permease small subunit
MVHKSDVSAQSPAGRRLKRVLGVYTRIDGAIFAVEAAIVTAATALMTLFIFLDLSFTFLNGLRVRLFTESGRAGGLEGSRIVALVLATLLVIGLAGAAVGAHPPPQKRGGRWQAGVFLALLGGLGLFCYLLVAAPPRVTLSALVVVGGLYSFRRLWPAVQAGEYGKRALVIWALAVALVMWFAGTVPDRYSSWTQPYALFLLLWTGFIGASMATSRGRHLRIDAVRKALPASVLGRYNFASNLLAGALTGVFCYLSIRYTFARFGNPAPAGEIPDWLKVLAIPVSLAFITLRFVTRALLNLMGWDEPAASEAALQVAEKTEGSA